MCGIVGYTGARCAAPLILAGLQQLEYRGYDSAGIAVLDRAAFAVRKQAGKLSQLLQLIEQQPLPNVGAGIGHTRWATHGAPTAGNAHPLVGPAGTVVIVHNGIVENYHELKAELMAQGAHFVTETDSEVIVHLLERQVAVGLSLAVAMRLTAAQLQGANVIVAMASAASGELVALRLGNAGGVVVGVADEGNFIASDAPALLAHTRRVLYLAPQQMAIVHQDFVHIETLAGESVEPVLHLCDYNTGAADKGHYRHFMQKEIHEQAMTLGLALAGRIDYRQGKVRLDELQLTRDFACQLERLCITACGSSAYVGMIGKYLIEKLARIPVDVSIASEFRYSEPVLHRRTAVLAISQSGETADTLAALAEGKRQGARLWSIVNVLGSEACRVADGHIAMRCGPETGVASTKAFTASLLDMYLLAVLLGDLRGVLGKVERCRLLDDLMAVPGLVTATLARESAIEMVAASLLDMQHCLFLGRGPQMPIALEGALKLKELAYVHAEGLAAGEMKHGPIALVEPGLPLVCLTPRDAWHGKMLSQIEQAKARGGQVIAVATDGDDRVATMADQVLWIPPVAPLLAPVVSVLPLQLLAYHSALLRGFNVDQPRNLAKSVTVE